MEFYAAERKKELIPFAMAWMELESIMLTEIRQVAKDKYYLILPISGTYSTKQTSDQNRTRDMEIKNKLMVSLEGRGMGDNGKRRGEVKSQNMYKRPMDKDHGGGRIECGRWGVDMAREGNGGGEMGTTVIEQ